MWALRRLPEIEIGEEGAVRQLVLEALDKKVRPGGNLVGQPGFPQPLPDVARSAPMDGDGTIDPYIDIGEMPFHGFGGCLLDRQEFDSSGPEGLAGGLQGAGEAGWIDRRAAGCAKVHHALVEGRGGIGRKQPLREVRELLLCSGCPDRHGDSEVPRKDAVHVSVHDGGRKVEGDGADGCGRVP